MKIQLLQDVMEENKKYCITSQTQENSRYTHQSWRTHPFWADADKKKIAQIFVSSKNLSNLHLTMHVPLIPLWRLREIQVREHRGCWFLGSSVAG